MKIGENDDSIEELQSVRMRGDRDNKCLSCFLGDDYGLVEVNYDQN